MLLLGLAPLAALVFRGATRGLGANPIEEITHETGYCLTWKTWKRGIRRCMDMIPKEGRYEFRTKDGTLQSIVELLPGNPHGL